MRIAIFIATSLLVVGVSHSDSSTDYVKFKKYLIPFTQKNNTPPLSSTWSFPQAGENFPAENSINHNRNTAHNYIDQEKCVVDIRIVNCIGISNVHPGVIVYVYPQGDHHNAFFISTYAKLLRTDCDRNQDTGEVLGTLSACDYYQRQLDYIGQSKISPQPTFDIWPIDNGMADAMTQSQIAELYLYEKDFQAVERIGNSFDWTWSKGGLAHVYSNSRYWYMSAGVNETQRRNSLNVHNKALEDIHQMIGTMERPDYNVSEQEINRWKQRMNRGIEALFSYLQLFDCDASCINGPGWSYARTIPSRVEGSGGENGYHALNYKTLQRLMNYGYDRSSQLLRYCNRWKSKQFGTYCSE